MRCVAQSNHEETSFRVRLHGGKLKSTFNYRKHIEMMKSRSNLKSESKNKIDSIAENLLIRQTEIGRQRTSNKHKR